MVKDWVEKLVSMVRIAANGGIVEVDCRSQNCCSLYDVKHDFPQELRPPVEKISA